MDMFSDISIAIIVFTLIAGLIIYGLIDFVMKFHKVKHLPGPMPLPFIGNILMENVITAPWTFTMQMRNKYGKVYCVWFGPTPWVILSDYESVRFAFTQDKIFPKDETYSKYLGIGFGDGLISVTDRVKHRKDKSLLLPFFTMNKVKTLIPMFCENTTWTMNKFLGDKTKVHEDIDLEEVMLYLTYRFIMRYVWDRKIENDDEEFTKWSIRKFCEGNQAVIMMAIFRMPTNTRINPIAADCYASYEALLGLQREQLAEREGKEDEYDDLFATLLKAGMPHSRIAYHVCTLLGAGHDTTAYWISMSLLMLAKNPECQQKVYEEAMAYFNSDEACQEGDILPQFRYTLACMKETMRLKPIVSCTTRKSASESLVPCNSGEKHRVPKDMNVMLALYLMQRDYEDPSSFKPERFMGDEQGFSTPGFFPFAYGPRTCIGKVLTIVESILVVAHFVKDYELLQVPGYKPKNNLYGVSTTVANGVRVKLLPRN